MEAVQAGLDEAIDRHGKFVSGFGHRFHPIDPRAPRLLQLVDEASAQQVVNGKFAAIARGVEAELAGRKNGRRIPMNIDRCTELGASELFTGSLAPLAGAFPSKGAGRALDRIASGTSGGASPDSASGDAMD
ncbi:MAG TPA: hypothetical protein VIN75_25565 [Burkholderiaceae bacterium]